MKKPFVSYLRVSTQGQGKSGLGLEAQRAAVKDYVARESGALLNEFTEIETGKRADRPELVKAMAFAKRAGAALIVAKLDRLARNVAFLARLMESGVDFLACDNPHANRFTVHILAAVAEYEAALISERTRAGLAALKARGVKLGSARPGHWEGREEARRIGGERGRVQAAKVITAKAREEYADLAPRVIEMRKAGQTLSQIAATLNEEGQHTRRGKEFHASQVKNILTYFEEKGGPRTE